MTPVPLIPLAALPAIRREENPLRAVWGLVEVMGRLHSHFYCLEPEFCTFASSATGVPVSKSMIRRALQQLIERKVVQQLAPIKSDGIHFERAYRLTTHFSGSPAYDASSFLRQLGCPELDELEGLRTANFALEKEMARLQAWREHASKQESDGENECGDAWSAVILNGGGGKFKVRGRK